MKNLIKLITLFSSSKIIHNSMNSSMKINYLDKKIVHEFDKTKKYLLYMHIPFCESFCSFCSFHKFKYDENDCKRFFKKLRLEVLKIKEQGFDFDTLYIGGGTPLINETELLKTIEFTKELFDIKKVSCETTSNHIKPEVMKDFVGLIDRLSIGVQSFDESILKATSRFSKYGTSKEIQEKISNIVGYFPVVSLDLIFNFPNQTKEMLLEDIKISKELGVDQIVTYPLMSSKLREYSFLEHLKDLKQSKEFEFYSLIKEQLKDYKQVNAWAFSRDRSELIDEYIVNSNEYIGVGSGAFSHINKKLYINAYDLNDYCSLIENNSNAIIAMTGEFKLRKYIQYNFLIQLFSGEVDIKSFNFNFKITIEQILKMELFLLKLVGAIVIVNGKILPTKFGEYITLIMMREFYVGMDSIRANLRQTIKSK